jgi:hypothetical protein
MNWNLLVKSAQRIVVGNSPIILTAIGVTGTITTAYLASKATVKAVELLRDEREYNHDQKIEVPLSSKEIFALTWKLYIPAASSAALTVAAIICANRISSRRAAALAVAYSLSEKAFEEYRTKILDKMGDKKERAVRDEIVQDHIARNPISQSTVIITGNGDVLCYDDFTGRYFTSTVEKLRKAENDINHQLIHDHYASLSDFYDALGLPQTGVSDNVGWNLDRMLELTITGALTDDSRPCLAISYEVSPAGDRFRCL